MTKGATPVRALHSRSFHLSRSGRRSRGMSSPDLAAKTTPPRGGTLCAIATTGDVVLDQARLRGANRRLEAGTVDLGNEPPLSVDGGSGGLVDRRRFSLQWFSGTILTGLCGAALMGGAVFASLDGETNFAAAPERVETALRGALNGIGEHVAGLRKTDRLAAITEPSVARLILRIPTSTRVRERELVRTRNFVRVSGTLSLSASELSANIPPFNPQKLLTEGVANADDAGGRTGCRGFLRHLRFRLVRRQGQRRAGGLRSQLAAAEGEGVGPAVARRRRHPRARRRQQRRTGRAAGERRCRGAGPQAQLRRGGRHRSLCRLRGARGAGEHHAPAEDHDGERVERARRSGEEGRHRRLDPARPRGDDRRYQGDQCGPRRARARRRAQGRPEAAGPYRRRRVGPHAAAARHHRRRQRDRGRGRALRQGPIRRARRPQHRQ